MTFRDPPRGPSRRTISRRFEIYNRVLPGEIAITLAEFTPVNSQRGSGIIELMGPRVQVFLDEGEQPDDAKDLAYDEVVAAVESGEEIPWQLASLVSP